MKPIKSGTSSSAKYYRKNSKARAKKKRYDSEYQKDRVKYRTKLNKENRKRGTYGNGDGKDLSHTKTGGLVQESQSANRARNRGKK